MNNPKVDIILPNFNSSDFILKTVQSIKKQSYKNWKLVIVDDNSNLKTKKILKKISKSKKIKVYWSKKNSGAAHCRNFAIRQTNSPFIAFIDSDDLWEKNKLKAQVEFMKKNNISFSYTFYNTFGDKIKSIKPKLKFSFNDFVHNTSIATSTMMVKRKDIKNIKFTNTKICEDYFFKCKLLKRVGFAFCLQKFLTKYRIRRNSLQSSNLRNFYWIWKINKKYNKFNFFQNLTSLIAISINSIKKYNAKNIL